MPVVQPFVGQAGKVGSRGLTALRDHVMLSGGNAGILRAPKYQACLIFHPPRSPASPV